MGYWPEAIQVIPVEDYKVYVYFSDGNIRIYDASELVKKGVFKQLQKNNLFFDACTVLNNTLAWTLDLSYDNKTCLDIDPFTIYHNSKAVEEPAYLFQKI